MKIVIYQEDNTVHAKLIDAGETIKESVARCAPSDEFVFETGARLAMGRLFEKPKPLEKFEPYKRYRFTRRLYIENGGTCDSADQSSYPAKYYDKEVHQVSPWMALAGYDALGKHHVRPEWCEEIKEG